MTSKLIPANPSAVMVIRALSPNITTLSAPFLRFGKIKVGGRGTIIRTSSGGLAIFSPVALTPEVQSTLSSLGNDVRWVIAGDMEHHIFLGEWARAFPSAKILGPEGLPEKRAKQGNEDVKFAQVFTADRQTGIKVDEDFDKDIAVEYVPAHPNKEVVLFYKKEKTLVEADLMFNLPATEQYSRTGESAESGFFTKIFSSFQGTQGSALGQKRFAYHVLARGDRAGFDASVQRIAGWGFERIIPCHGDVIETGGKEVFEKVFEWNLNDAKKVAESK